MPTVHLVIKGKVQGVFYRANTKKIANEKGITGWVQNTKDGNVEITASGSQPALDSFIDWCYKGPARAKVTSVKITEKEAETFGEFTLKR